MNIPYQTETITLPSGPTATVRELLGRDENIITNQQLNKQNRMIGKLLSGLIEEIGGVEPNERSVAELYTADRRAILLAVRQLTYGPEVEVEVTCENTRCGKQFEVALNLDEDVVWEPMPEQLNGEVKLPSSGFDAVVKPMTGEMEGKLAKAADSDEALTDMMVVRLEKIGDLSSAQFRPFLNNCSGRDRQALRKAMESVEFGPDTRVKAPCPHCNTQHNIEVTNQYRFFFPEG